jgi:hypothetical protein
VADKSEETPSGLNDGTGWKENNMQRSENLSLSRLVTRRPTVKNSITVAPIVDGNTKCIHIYNVEGC